MNQSQAVASDHGASLSETQELQPIIEAALNCRLILIDKDADPLQHLLDVEAGIDAFAVFDGLAGPRAVALRTQHGNWRTHTIRYRRASGRPTEWQKYDPTANALMPNVTIQLYIDDFQLHIGAIKSSELFSFARENEKTLEVRSTPDGTDFLVVPWDELVPHGLVEKSVECPGCRRKEKSK